MLCWQSLPLRFPLFSAILSDMLLLLSHTALCHWWQSSWHGCYLHCVWRKLSPWSLGDIRYPLNTAIKDFSIFSAVRWLHRSIKLISGFPMLRQTFSQVALLSGLSHRLQDYSIFPCTYIWTFISSICLYDYNHLSDKPYEYCGLDPTLSCSVYSGKPTWVT